MKILNTFIWTHSLHLLAITVLGGLVWYDLHRNSETILFQSFHVSHAFARERLNVGSMELLGYVQRNAETFRNSATATYLDRAIRMNQLCDSVLQLIDDEQVLPLTLNHNLTVLKDSLSASVDGDIELVPVFDTDLMRNSLPNIVKLLSDARVSERTMLRSNIGVNIFLAKSQVLYYFMQKVSGSHDITDPFEIVWQPDAICPESDESFAVTCIITSHTYPYLRPQSAKVWVNGAGIPVKDGYATFTTRFDKKGPQPLAVRVELRDWKSDSLRVFEKIYTVNVK